MKKLPIVALIGLTNAGKSSLLNRLAHKSIAITAREAGTTRDNVVATIDGKFTLVDTAGLKNPEDDFEASIQDQIADAIDVADAIVFAIDSTQYPGQEEQLIAKLAHKSGKPIILALNKSDLGEALPEYEFSRLGVKNIVRTSATTGQGAKELKEVIQANIPSRNEMPDQETSDKLIKLALIGRPNVGKSSLFNTLAQKQQAIVANLSGTTRDINRTAVKFHETEIELLDTAGVRKPGKREVGIEKFSVLRTLAAIEESDICALIIDASDPRAKLDQALAGQIVDAGKGIMLIVTKTDLLKEEDFEIPVTIETYQTKGRSKKNAEAEAEPVKFSPIDRILDSLERDFNFIPYAPVIVTSSVTGKNATKIFDLALDIKKERETTLRTADLNKILGDALLYHHPAAVKGVTPKPKYIVQTDTTPPWFVIHGTNLQLLHFSYERYLENRIRDFHPFIGTPIKFSIRNSETQRRKSDQPKRKSDFDAQ